MAYSYDETIKRAFVLCEQKAVHSSQRLLAETKAKQAARGYIGTSTPDAQALGKAIIESNVALAHELFRDLDRIISTGGADVPANPAEKLSETVEGMLTYLGDMPVKMAKTYFGEDGGMAQAAFGRVQMAWAPARIGLQQEFSLLVRKHRNAQGGQEAPKPAKTKRSTLNRQVRPVHFEDQSGKDFERLVYEFALLEWHKVEWLGEVGGDDGVDIRCTAKDGTATVIACANYQELTLTKAFSDLGKIAKLEAKPERVRIVTGGTVSPKLRARIQAEAKKLGLPDCEIWSGSEFEAQLRAKAEHLLKRYCEGHEFPLAGGDDDGEERAEAKADIQLNPEKLSDEAKKLLYAMSEAKHGDLLRSVCHDGYALTVGNVDFVLTTDNRREIARWNRVIKELFEAGFIELEGADNDNLAITDEGYDAVDGMGLIR